MQNRTVLAKISVGTNGIKLTHTPVAVCWFIGVFYGGRIHFQFDWVDICEVKG